MRKNTDAPEGASSIELRRRSSDSTRLSPLRRFTYECLAVAAVLPLLLAWLATQSGLWHANALIHDEWLARTQPPAWNGVVVIALDASPAVAALGDEAQRLGSRRPPLRTGDEAVGLHLVQHEIAPFQRRLLGSLELGVVGAGDGLVEHRGQVVADGVGQHEVAVGEALHEGRGAEAVRAVVGEVGFAADEEAGHVGLQVVVHPEAAHRVVHRGEDAHRLAIRVLAGDVLVHVEQVPVAL